jgi:two-component system chemotaxis family response regulator WspR
MQSAAVAGDSFSWQHWPNRPVRNLKRAPIFQENLMEIPIAKLDAAGTASFPSSDEYISLVLLVDDQLMIGEAIRGVMAGQPNLDFYYCADPQEAVSVAEQVKPTVILQDLVMPGVDGLALLRRYRANPIIKDVPVIILSSKEDPAVKSEAFKQGANDYLIKPPDPIELIARIRYHSKAYLNQIQRDEAYRALRESQQSLLKANLELQRLNNIDALTGMNNRRSCDDYLAAEWKRAIREQTTLSVLMIDVDDFKGYNDTYGRLPGDEALKKVAATIKQSFTRPADLVARFGGEEFIVALPNTALAGAQYLAEKIRYDVGKLRIPHRASKTAGHVTISVGVASTIPQRTDAFTTLVNAADAAMYEAKKTGGNRIITQPAIDR